MQQHVSMVQIILSADTSNPGSKFNFSDHGYVAFQIKWNHECSNIVTNILSSPNPWGGSKGQNSTFQKMVMLRIKLNLLHQIRREWSIEHLASAYSVLTHTIDPRGGVKGQNIVF